METFMPIVLTATALAGFALFFASINFFEKI